jgi:hypothetical protein
MPISAKTLAALEETFILADDRRLTFKGLFYGPSGVGKTVEAMEVAQIVTPVDKEILFIDTSDGWVSLKNHPGLSRRTRLMNYEGLSQYEAIVQALQEGAGSFAKVGTIVFDEISTTGKRDLNNVAKATALGEFEAMEFKHYNIATRRMERILTEIMKLRETHNLIFVSHMKERKNKRTEISVREPSVMPAFGETLKEGLHLVAFMQTDIKHSEKDTGTAKYVWTMQVHPSKMTVAKTRIGGLDIIVSPKQFNERLKTWISRENTTLSDVEEIVELPEEKEIKADVDDNVTFAGYEIGEN